MGESKRNPLPLGCREARKENSSHCFWSVGNQDQQCSKRSIKGQWEWVIEQEPSPVTALLLWSLMTKEKKSGVVTRWGFGENQEFNA